MNNRFKGLLLADTFWYFLNGLIAPFLTIYFNDFGGFEEVGISVALLYIIQGVTSVFAGKLLQRFKARKVLLISQIFEGLRVLLFLFVSDIYSVYFIQAIGGVTTGFVSPSYNKLFVKVGSNEEGTSFGNRGALISVSIGLSAVISGFIINYFGYAPVFIIWSITEIFYGILLFRV